MHERLGALYHWSPRERRDDIRAHGLQPYSASNSIDARFPYVCLALTPSSAWALSGDMDWGHEIDDWDLWQVRLDDGDEVHYRSDFGPWMREVRVHSPIPADRVWYIATRTQAGL